MPMSFPTLESLVSRAGSRNFRKPLKNETEAQYRQAFYEFMQYVDSVEASEIRSGAGWDQQDPSSVLASFFNRQETAPLYVWNLAVIKLESPITSIEIDENNKKYGEKLKIKVTSSLIDQYEVDSEDDELTYRDLIKKYSDVLPVERRYVVAEPKGFEQVAYSECLSQYIDLWRHKLTGELLTVVNSRSYAMFIATPEQMMEFAETRHVTVTEPDYA